MVKKVRITSLLLNSLLAIVFSYILSFCISTINQGITSLDITTFKIFIINNKTYTAISILTILLSYFHVRRLYLLIPFTLTYSVLFQSMIFFDSFNKLILLLIVAHALIALAASLSWIRESLSPLYDPLYHKNSLGEKSLYSFECSLISSKGETIKGHLLNWSNNEAFIHTARPLLNIKDKYILEISSFNRIFKAQCLVYTTYHGGIGIKLFEIDEENFSWDDYVTIISHRGYSPVI